jgi:hypothetical protein
MKSGELTKRREAKAVAGERLEEAMDAGDMEEVKRQSQRTVHVTT